MDPILLLVILIFVVLVAFALWQSQQNPKRNAPEGVEPTTEEFEFDEDTENVTRTSMRKIRITAPPQARDGTRVKLRIQPQPLPNVQDLTIPEGKNLDALVTTVLNPRVEYADNGQEINTFDPPLILRVNYKKQDADATQTVNGAPQLSLVTGYRTNNGWKLERLATTVIPDDKTGGGICTASVSNLQPADPIFLFRP